MEISKTKTCFIFFVIVSAIFLSPTFGFALSGDDWLTLYRFKVGYTSIGDYFNLNNFSSNYDFANILMGFIYKLFGTNSYVYFVISFSLKIILSISIYYFLNYFDSNKVKNSIISSSILLLNAGNESINWVFNMHIFIAVIFLLIVIYAIDRFKTRRKFLIIPTLIFGCFLISPTRMHGLIILIPLLVWLYKKDLKDFLLSTIVYLLPITIFRLVIQSSNDNLIQIINKDIYSYFQAINSLFASLYNSIIPSRYGLVSTLISTLSITILFILVFKSNLKRIYKILSIVPIIFLLIPQLINYQSGFESVHRYLLIPGIFFWIVITNYLFTYFKNRYLILIIFSILIITNGLSSHYYFNNLLINGRSSIITDTIYNQLISFTDSHKVDENTLFLFTSENTFLQYNAIEFGLTPKLLFLEPRYNQDTTKAPNIVESKLSLIKLLNGDQNEISRYGFNNKSIHLDNVYHFHISKDNSLMDITPELINEMKNDYNVNK